jgi:hypothetical protein
MIWIAPSEKDRDSEALEKRLWAAADQLRANSGLTSQQYSQPVLGFDFSPVLLKSVSPNHVRCNRPEEVLPWLEEALRLRSRTIQTLI